MFRFVPMFRFVIVSAVFALFTLPAIAQSDAERRARVERALDQLPSQGDIETAMDQLPDITGLMTGLADVAVDEDNQRTLESLLGRLENEFSAFEQSANNGGIPDINGLLEGVMLLSADREFMGDALDLAFQVQDVVSEALPADAKP